MYLAEEAAIRERAYAIWEEEGRPEGREWDHWVRASREILARMPAPAQAGARSETPAAVAAARPNAARRSPAAKDRGRNGSKAIS
jgi:hypothetical protein